ncbi:MAG: hypothetical protein PHY73_06820 [Candidatus Omnitrophica bacterium]|nr:hypothetical protein [Candidatus Omnitrophota bacterium]
MLNHKITKKTTFFKVGVFFVLMVFMGTTVFPPSAFANTGLLGLPNPGVMVPSSPGFAPAMLRGIKIYPNNPLKFDFILDSGDTGLKGETLKPESKKLIKYFLASLTISDEDLWVNLSPYEKDRIIPSKLGLTEMGRDMLAQDYLLKQITASLISPEDELGKKFWDKVYKKAYQQYGTTDIPVGTFNKVWIVPQKAAVYENGDRALVVESKLKVMLEEDYLATQESRKSQTVSPQSVNFAGYSAQLTNEIVREIIIPELEREVNEGKHFAPLRQIYSSLILAYWFKNNLKDAILNKVYADKGKVRGIDVEDKEITQKIYDQYLAAFKKGACDIIKIEYDKNTQQNIPRKYFSGGFNMMLKNSDYVAGTTLSGDQGNNLALLAGKDRFSFIQSEVEQFVSSNLLKKEGDRIDAETGLIGSAYNNFFWLDGSEVGRTNLSMQVYNDTNEIFLGTEDGKHVYDKMGERVGSLTFSGEKLDDSKKGSLINEIKLKINMRKKSKGKITMGRVGTSLVSNKLRKNDIKIAEGIVELLKDLDIYFLDDNIHGFKGVFDPIGHRIFLNKEVVTAIGVFHEAGEGFLRLEENRKLLKKALQKKEWGSIHRYLRGDGKTIRLQYPRAFRYGLQDKIFGPEENQEYTEHVGHIINESFGLAPTTKKFHMTDEQMSSLFTFEKVSESDRKKIEEALSEAIEKTDRAISGHPKIANIHREIAELSYRLGDFRNARFFIDLAYGDFREIVRINATSEEWGRMTDSNLPDESFQHELMLDSPKLSDTEIALFKKILRARAKIKKAEEARKSLEKIPFPAFIPNIDSPGHFVKLFQFLDIAERRKLYDIIGDLYEKIFEKNPKSGALFRGKEDISKFLNVQEKEVLGKYYVNIERILWDGKDLYIPFFFGAVFKASKDSYVRADTDGRWENLLLQKGYPMEEFPLANFLKIYKEHDPGVRLVLHLGSGSGEITKGYVDRFYNADSKNVFVLANDVNPLNLRTAIDSSRETKVTVFRGNLAEATFVAFSKDKEIVPELFDSIFFAGLDEFSGYSYAHLLNLVHRAEESLFADDGQVEVLIKQDDLETRNALEAWGFELAGHFFGDRYVLDLSKKGSRLNRDQRDVENSIGSSSIQAPGGIDFDADGFEIESRGKGIALDISEIDITALSQAEGFVPIIINIVPITSFNMLMGLSEGGGKEGEILSLTRLDDAHGD